MTKHPSSFFERYQTFFSIIIAGSLIAGGIILSKVLPSNGTVQQDLGETSQVDVDKNLVAAAKKINVSKKNLEACLETGTYRQTIDTAITLAQETGVQGTPTFIILKRTFAADNSIANEKQFSIVGARDEATFLKAIADGMSPADQGDTVVGKPVVISESDHYKGPKNAETVIVAYSDIDCPFCKRAHPILEKILADHPEFGYVYRYSPIISLHPFAGYKAEAAECVKEIGGEESFWKFLDIIAR